MLLDQAARLAAAAGDNALSRHDTQVKQILEKSGTDAALAEKLARARVFGTKPGSYGVSVQQMVEQSKDADSKQAVADLYLHHMNFAYSAEIWGETTPQALASHLKGNQVILLSRSSNVYGVVDNNDTYQYAGGLNLATKLLNEQQAPAFYLHNLRKAGDEELEDMRTWLATELNARSWNPKWISQMKSSGYAGAREMAAEVEHLYGFQATSAEQMSTQFWRNTYDVYVADKHGLDLQPFFEQSNPYAGQMILARLLEVDRQGTYRFADAERKQMVEQYIRSVNRHGVACSANTCGNARVHRYMTRQANLISGLGQMELERFGRTVERATKGPSWQFAARTRPAPAVALNPRVRGFVLRQRTIHLSEPDLASQVSVAGWTAALLSLLAAGALLEARRLRRQGTGAASQRL
jgi:cobaltochelatase CobN